MRRSHAIKTAGRSILCASNLNRGVRSRPESVAANRSVHILLSRSYGGRNAGATRAPLASRGRCHWHCHWANWAARVVVTTCCLDYSGSLKCGEGGDRTFLFVLAAPGPASCCVPNRRRSPRRRCRRAALVPPSLVPRPQAAAGVGDSSLGHGPHMHSPRDVWLMTRAICWTDAHSASG